MGIVASKHNDITYLTDADKYIAAFRDYSDYLQGKETDILDLEFIQTLISVHKSTIERLDEILSAVFLDGRPCSIRDRIDDLIERQELKFFHSSHLGVAFGNKT